MDVEVEGAVVAERLRRRTTACDSTVEDGIGSVRDVAVEFVAGCVSGFAGIVVGQPFDTVKVRLQTQDMGDSVSHATQAAAGTKSPPAVAVAATADSARTVSELRQGQPRRVQGAVACAMEAVSKEGFSALFKGMGAPLASAALVNAITFAAYAHSQRVFRACGLVVNEPSATRDAEEGVASEREAQASRINGGLFWSFAGGCFAGICQTVVVIPAENIKVKLQVQVGALGSSKLRYKGPVDCAMKLVKKHGVRSLYRGASSTMVRDTPGIGLYFASYEGMRTWMERRWGFGEQTSSCWAGGLAGALSWVFIYPFDLVKSIQQAASDPRDPSTRTMYACFRSVYNSAGGGVPGVRRLFRGLGTTMVRAVPVNAAIFPTFEWTARVLNEAFPPSKHS